MEKYYKISQSRLFELLESERFADALIRAGADNWAGYYDYIQPIDLSEFDETGKLEIFK